MPDLGNADSNATAAHNAGGFQKPEKLSKQHIPNTDHYTGVLDYIPSTDMP